MHGIWKAIGSFVRRADMILLSLCIAASVYGIVVISSATNVNGSAQYVRTQILALVLGIILYIVFTLIDVDIIAERRELLLIFSAIFILLLFPHNGTGQTVARMSDRPVNTSQWITTHFARGVVPPFSFEYGGKPSQEFIKSWSYTCLLYTSPSPRDTR